VRLRLALLEFAGDVLERAVDGDVAERAEGIAEVEPAQVERFAGT